MIDFDEAAHRYVVDGKVRPSVTQILEVVDEIWRVPFEVLERARKLGTAVHRATELFDRDDLDESSVDPAIEPYLRSYQRFRSETGFVPDHVEMRLYHAQMGYCGTLDRVGQMNGKRALLDIKSGEEWPSHGPQTAAYEQAFEHMTKQKVSARFGLYLRDDGTYRLQPKKDPSDWSVFLACLTIQRFKER